MSQPQLHHVPAQQVCDIEAPGHTTRYLDLPFLVAAIPVHIRVLSIRRQAITFATDSGITTWYHHEPKRLAAAAVASLVGSAAGVEHPLRSIRV